MSEAADKSNNLQNAFQAPHEESVVEGGLQPYKYLMLTFPLMEMDDWAQVCTTLHAQRRRAHELKLNTNSMLSASDRAWLLMRFDDNPTTINEAVHYRTQTPVGIKTTCIRSLIKGGMSEDEAKKALKSIPPLRQKNIALAIADPPIPPTEEEKRKMDEEAKKQGKKSEAQASTIGTGTGTPASSGDSLEETQESLP